MSRFIGKENFSGEIGYKNNFNAGINRLHDRFCFQSRYKGIYVRIVGIIHRNFSQYMSIFEIIVHAFGDVYPNNPINGKNFLGRNTWIPWYEIKIFFQEIEMLASTPKRSKLNGRP